VFYKEAENYESLYFCWVPSGYCQNGWIISAFWGIFRNKVHCHWKVPLPVLWPISWVFWLLGGLFPLAFSIGWMHCLSSLYIFKIYIVPVNFARMDLFLPRSWTQENSESFRAAHNPNSEINNWIYWSMELGPFALIIISLSSVTVFQRWLAGCGVLTRLSLINLPTRFLILWRPVKLITALY
jgi:hypothetical protein